MSELYHHGILGMHWGIRRYQPYGSGGYNPKKLTKKIVKKSQKDNYPFQSDERNVSKIPEVKQIHKNLYDKGKQYRDYEKIELEYIKLSPEESEKYDRKAYEWYYENIFSDYDKTPDRDPKNGYFDSEDWEIYKNEDWNDGDASSFDFFLRDKYNMNVNEFEEKRADARREYRNECKKVTDMILGEYANYSFSANNDYKNNQTVSYTIVSALDTLLRDDVRKHK